MIELIATATKVGKGYNVETEVTIEGKGERIACELCSVFNHLEKDAPEVFHGALEMFLCQRGC